MSLTNILKEAVQGGKFLETTEEALEWAKENVDGVQKAFDELENLEGKSEFQKANTIFKAEGFEELAEDYSYKYMEMKKQSEVEIYRMIKINSINDIDFNDVGKHWSFEEDGAGIYNPSSGSKKILLTGVTDPRNIDWKYGFTSFMWFTQAQWECALKKNSEVTIIKIDDKELQKPIKAKVNKT